MTRSNHREAANRLQEVSNSIVADFYIQINGDEPLVNPEYVDAAIPDYIPQDIEYGTNLITKMINPAEVNDTSNIKVVFDVENIATYMSRQAIPCPYRSIEFDYYKHIGVIGYNKKMLDFYESHGPGIFEKIEGIATLRFTDYGKKLLCIEVPDGESLSVDTEKDLEYVRKKIKAKLDNGQLDYYKELLS